MKKNLLIGVVTVIILLILWWVVDWVQYRQTFHMGWMMKTMHNTMSMMGGMGHHRVTSEESFISDMIPHHQEAVDTSARLNTITQNPALKELTQAIVDGQTTEIVMMQRWLNEWYPDNSYVSTYMPMMRDTSTISAINTIEKFWLEDMIQHHMGAVMMAEQVLGLNPRPEVAQFAKSIIDVQTNEIVLMKNILQSY